jgi:Lantibiotic biosynthesis dehydratase C-term
MSIAHDLFCADSRGALDYLRREAPGIGRRELSLLLISALWRAAGLDHFECGDVFDRVSRLRPPPSGTDSERLEKLANNVRPFLTLPIHAGSSPVAPDDPAVYAAPWRPHSKPRAANSARRPPQAGWTGACAVLTHVVIFIGTGSVSPPLPKGSSPARRKPLFCPGANPLYMSRPDRWLEPYRHENGLMRAVFRVGGHDDSVRHVNSSASPSISDEVIYGIPDLVEPGDTVWVAGDHPHVDAIECRIHVIALLGKVFIVADNEGDGEPILGLPYRGRKAEVLIPRSANLISESARKPFLHTIQGGRSKASATSYTLIRIGPESLSITVSQGTTRRWRPGSRR